MHQYTSNFNGKIYLEINPSKLANSMLPLPIFTTKDNTKTLHYDHENKFSERTEKSRACIAIYAIYVLVCPT